MLLEFQLLPEPLVLPRGARERLELLLSGPQRCPTGLELPLGCAERLNCAEGRSRRGRGNRP